MSDIIVRDYAYEFDDPRFGGVFPPLEPRSKHSSRFESRDLGEDDRDAGNAGDWYWSFNGSGAESVKQGSNVGIGLSIVEESDLDSVIIPLFKDVIQNAIVGMTVNIFRARTIFPFTRGTEYEMSLESSDRLLIIESAVPSKLSDLNVEINEPKLSTTISEDRWSSIDISPKINHGQIIQKNIKIVLCPDASAFGQEIKQFLEFNRNYGDGWFTAIKIKIVGNYQHYNAKLILKDIGLVPANYLQYGKDL